MDTTGTNGSDILTGSTGNDTLSGGNGNDILNGGAGDDILNGGNGGDVLNGGSGNDALYGGNGNDTLDGGEGYDKIYAGNGDDLLFLDEFDQVIDGQNGFDTLVFTRNGQTLDLRGNTSVAGIESIQLLAGGHNSLTLTAADIIRISDNDTLVIQGDDSDSVNFADGGWALTSVATDGSFVYSNGTMQIKLAAAVSALGVAASNATIGAPSNSDVLEDSSPVTLSVSGTIPVSDPQAWTALLRTHVMPAAGNLGSLTLAADGLFSGSSSGQYTYSVSNAAVQFLGAGVVHTDSFTVISLDGTTAVVTFNVIGVNDPAQISGATTLDLTEDSGVVAGKLNTSFSLAVTDVDSGEAGFGYAVGDVVASTGNLGTLTYAGNGVFNYSVDNSLVQYLNEGVSRAERFDVFSLDGTKQTLQVNITGKDDPTSISLPAHIPSMTEDVTDPANPGYLTASCKLVIHDADAVPGQLAPVLSDVIVNGESAGYVMVQPDGTVSAVVANSAVQYLGEGDKLSVGSVVYDANFNPIGDVSFEVIGKNDPAVIDTSGLNTQLKEDTNLQLGALFTAGQITITDVDQGEAALVPGFLVFTEQGGLGRIDASGGIEYGISNDLVQHLGEGQTMTDHMTVTAVDGTTKTIAFTITGTNDAPTLVPGTTQGSVAAYASGASSTAPHVVTGSFQVGDVDIGDALTVQVTPLGSGYIGSLSAASLVSNGDTQQASWVFTVDDAAIVNLGVGADLTQSYQVSVADPYTHASTTMRVDIHITGVQGTGGTGDTFVWHGTGYVGPYIGASTPITNNGDHITGSDQPIVSIVGGFGDDWFQGSAFADVLSGTGGNDRLEGNGGNDVLYGGAGNNQLFGGDGNDILVGQWGGDNFLTGGAGQDSFVSELVTGLGNSVTVLDFNPAEDNLQIWLVGMNASSSLVTVDANQHIYELHTHYTYSDASGQADIDSVTMRFVGVALTEAQVLSHLTYVYQ